VGESGEEPSPLRGGEEGGGGGGQQQGLPPPHDVEMQDLPHNEGAVNVAVGALDVSAIEEVRTVKVPAIGAERARADSTEEFRPRQ